MRERDICIGDAPLGVDEQRRGQLRQKVVIST
jgi:hypothetical protein